MAGMVRLLPWLLIGVVAAAPQTQSTAPPAADNVAEMVSHDIPATFQSKVNLVMVPVVVRDAGGRAVGKLQREDFLLFDKGKPQVITRFSVEKAGAVAPPIQNEAPSDTGDPTATQPGQPPPPVIAERYTAYLFDDVHLQFGDLARAREAAARHLAESLQPTDRAAIYSTSGQTMLDFTDDRAKLQETLLRLQPRPRALARGTDCPDVSYYQADLIQNKHDPSALQAAVLETLNCMSLDPTTQMATAQSMAQSAASRALAIGEDETRLALGVLRNVVRRVSAMPGQRAIVLVSPGFIFPYLEQEVTQLMDSAIRSNITISSAGCARALHHRNQRLPAHLQRRRGGHQIAPGA